MLKMIHVVLQAESARPEPVTSHLPPSPPHPPPPTFILPGLTELARRESLELGMGGGGGGGGAVRTYP